MMDVMADIAEAVGERFVRYVERSLGIMHSALERKEEDEELRRSSLALCALLPPFASSLSPFLPLLPLFAHSSSMSGLLGVCGFDI